MHELYKLKSKLIDELKQHGTQELSMGNLEVIDKLAHAGKNICKIIDDCEKEGYSETNSRNSYRGGSYARGRSAKRDAMGRYTRAEDEMDDMISELRGMMSELPEDKQKEVHRFIQRIEQM